MSVHLAKAVARMMHRGQKYGDRDYFDAHVERVARYVDRMPNTLPLHVQAAYLHDVIEDTSAEAHDLLALGFSKQVVAIVVALTRSERESYWEYIERVKQNRDAIKIKMADAHCHLASGPHPGQRERYERVVLEMESAL